MKCLLSATAAAIAVVVACSPVLAQQPKSVFDAPIIIQVNGQPLNQEGEILYPSPSVFDIDSDGKNELVLGSLFGNVYACENRNNSTGDPEWSEPKPINTRMEQPLELNNWCCVGMSPQSVDLNADGMNDMVMATFEGSAFLVEGTKDGFKMPQHLLDINEEVVRISMYWDEDAEDYRYVDRSADGETYVKEHHLTSATTVDWDEDGDFDLLLGAYEGALYLCLNEGTKNEPRFSETNLQVQADGKHLSISGGLATPHVCDWNQDGLFDILCGGSAGGVFYFKNVGEKGAPQFAAAQTLIQQVNENSYTIAGVPTKDGLPARPDRSFHIETVDYEGDGDLDMLVGSPSYFAAEDKELNEDQQQRLAKLKDEINEQSANLTKLFTDIAGDAEKMEQLYESEEFLELQGKLSELMLEKERLEPSLREANFVWLFRNNGGQGTYLFADANSPIEDDPISSAESLETEMFGDEFSGMDAIEFENELTVSAKFSETEGKTATLEIQIDVPEGHHIYGARNPTAPTKLAISNSGSLQMAELAKVPKGKIHMADGKRAYWLEGSVTILQTFQIPDGFETSTVEGHVDFMMCNERGCDPPKKVKFSATLKAK